MKKFILVLALILVLAGCGKEIVKVDVNGTVIKTYKELNAQVACDNRGYAYYVAVHTITPILENGIYGAYQLKCSEL